MTRAYVGLFSARGDSPGNLREGLERLRGIGSPGINSDLYRSAPDAAGQPDCYAMAVRLDTGLDALGLEQALQTVQTQAAADRDGDGALELWLELLAYGDVANKRTNFGPSPYRLCERPCVLAALAEIAPDLRLAEKGPTVAELAGERRTLGRQRRQRPL